MFTYVDVYKLIVLVPTTLKPHQTQPTPKQQKSFYGSVTRAGMPPLTPACRVPPPYRRNVYLRCVLIS